MLKLSNLSKIGIGTWGIGGFAQRNVNNNDEKQIKAIKYMFQKGANYIELNAWTSEGHSIKLAAKGLKQSGINRDKVFLSQAIYSYTSPNLEAAKNEVKLLLETFETDNMDSISLNEAAIASIGKENAITWYKELLNNETVRYINLNNPSMSSVVEFKNIFGDKLVSIEVGFNFEIRENKDNGIIDFAQENNIFCVIYQPLRRNRTALRNWPLLVELSKKYNKTQNQILLNWIVSHGYLPLTKSETIEHINEHFDAINFKLESADIQKLDEFRPPNYKSPQVYWGVSGEGVRIDQLSNVFDEEYKKQNP